VIRFEAAAGRSVCNSRRWQVWSGTGVLVMKRLRGFVALMLICLVTAGASLADGTFRCGSQLVEAGMSRAAVRGLCGEPTSTTVEVQDVHSGSRVVGKTTIERWTYASYSATRVLVFDQDTLKAIE
jgi:hypothetical protein